MLAGTYRKYRPFAVCGGWWLGGGDGFEVEFAAGRVDHGGEVVRVAEAAGPSLHVPDDAVGTLEDGVGVRVPGACDDLGEAAADQTCVLSNFCGPFRRFF